MARILVVDDVADNVKLLALELEDRGHEVLTSLSGPEALGIASAQQPDVILLDVMMPDMDGIEVCRGLKEDSHTRTIPVILVTAKGLDENVIAGLDAGANDYVPKPFNSEVLTARIRSALRVKQSYDTISRTNQLLREEITVRKRAEETVRKQEEELRQSQKLEAVGRLAGGIAHEFNNLLQAIGGYTSFAMEGLHAEDQRYQDLQQVRQATERATTLTRQLLGFSRRKPLCRRNIDVNQLIADLAVMIRPVIGEHIEFEVRQGTDIGYVHADPGELHQALLNLCLNARDAMPSGGKLVLRTENVTLSKAFNGFDSRMAPGRYVVVYVSDTGCGMGPEVRERAFEPFYTTKEVGEGTGLGLARVYGVVQQHGGTVHVDSEPGKGTTLKVYLPATDTTTDTGNEESVASAAGGTETILLAEDEKMVRDFAVRILTDAGYSVVVASNGEEAVRLFDENSDKISLVLLDAVMPKLVGREAYRHIKEIDPETKVVFCTGYDPETAQVNAILGEDVRLVEKPFDPDELLRTVRDVLDVEEQCAMSLCIGDIAGRKSVDLVSEDESDLPSDLAGKRGLSAEGNTTKPLSASVVL